jgi:hypothetical protein
VLTRPYYPVPLQANPAIPQVPAIATRVLTVCEASLSLRRASPAATLALQAPSRISWVNLVANRVALVRYHCPEHYMYIGSLSTSLNASAMTCLIVTTASSGSYQPQAQQQTCFPCEVGKYLDQPGQSEGCKQCAAGVLAVYSPPGCSFDILLCLQASTWIKAEQTRLQTAKRAHMASLRQPLVKLLASNAPSASMGPPAPTKLAKTLLVQNANVESIRMSLGSCTAKAVRRARTTMLPCRRYVRLAR